MAEALISVIVPVYNARPYLAECVGSILAQTYQQFELLLIDDGSTDGSDQLCQQLAAGDDRIRCYRQQNAGASAARNLGLSQVAGDDVTFVDADDGIEPYFLATLYEQLLAHQADIAVGNYYKYSEFDHSFYFHNLNKDDLVEVLSPQEALDYQCDINDYIGMAFITVWGKLFKRSLFDQIDFPTGLLIDDEVLTHKLFLTASRIVLVNKNAYLYRMRPNSVMTDQSQHLKRLADTIRAFEIKLTDMSLAGLSTELMSRRFAYILWDVKHRFEQEGWVDSHSSLYHQICQRLDWFNRYRS